MPAPYPQEFRDDVVRVARNREPGQKLAVIAKDFGISESCLTNWMRQADVEEGARPGKTREESSELCDARKRIRLLEQENGPHSRDRSRSRPAPGTRPLGGPPARAPHRSAS